MQSWQLGSFRLKAYARTQRAAKSCLVRSPGDGLEWIYAIGCLRIEDIERVLHCRSAGSHGVQLCADGSVDKIDVSIQQGDAKIRGVHDQRGDIVLCTSRVKVSLVKTPHTNCARKRAETLGVAVHTCSTLCP